MKYYLLILFISSQLFSQEKQQASLNDYECKHSKQQIIENKLYQKKYYGKIIQFKNRVTLTKTFRVDFLENDNLQIEVNNAVEDNLTDIEIIKYEAKSMNEVYVLLMELRKTIYNKKDKCHFSKYYFQIDYKNSTETHEYLYWLDYNQLEDFIRKKNKKKIFKILSQQQE